MYTNADGIKNKFHLLKARIQEEDPHVVCIVESSIHSNQLSENYCPDDYLEIENYQLFRKDNEQERKGGILMYIKDELIVYRNKLLDQMSADFKECIFLDLEYYGERVLVGTVYRKGASKADNNKLLNKIINKASKINKKLIICGDFNYPVINWATLDVSTGPYSPGAQFLECVMDNFLTQHVSKPTRARGTNKPSLIDLILTDSDQHLSDSLVHSCPFGKGDHDILTWKSLTSVSEDNVKVTEPPLPTWNVNKGDYTSLNSLLSNIDWNKEFEDLNLEEMVDRFYTLTKEKINECVPKTNPKHKNNKKPPWMSKSAKKTNQKKEMCLG